MKKLAVFASGAGSNFGAIAAAGKSGELRAEIVLLVCDRPNAEVIRRARNYGVPVFSFRPSDYDGKADYERAILEKLREAGVELIALAGYMRVLGETLLSEYDGRIVNIHPSLLPMFPGKNAIAKAFQSGAGETGVTVHYVDAGVDTGPIIAQQKIPILPEDSAETLEERIHRAEHELYVKTLKKLATSENPLERKKRALISVSDKRGAVEFAAGLVKNGYEIVSTGGTYELLKGLGAINISDVTGFPEALDGRVKTLHPSIHGGILALRDNPSHMARLSRLNISEIDLVAVNLYPFKEAVQKAGRAEAIENIDIGGPAMLRSAAKNHEHVTVVADPDDYEAVLGEISAGGVRPQTRKDLAAKAFRHTAAYDALIADYFTEEPYPEKLTLTYELKQPLRYGENPHQRAALYSVAISENSLLTAKQLMGKELSYNNIADADVALALAREFDMPAAVAVKHQNPCGVGIGGSAAEAYARAYEADPVSIFGGIIAINRTIDEKTAARLCEVFLEVIIAPGFSDEALAVFGRKKNLRLLEADMTKPRFARRRITGIDGGLLVQDSDDAVLDGAALSFPTARKPTEAELETAKFAWTVVKYVKSNGILIARDKMTVGIGPGQTNRVGAAKIAIAEAGERARGAVLASDAFFPMPDTAEEAAKAGISVIIQPGGSIRDKDSIEVCDKYNIAMIFTGIRHFRH